MSVAMVNISNVSWGVHREPGANNHVGQLGYHIERITIKVRFKLCFEIVECVDLAFVFLLVIDRCIVVGLGRVPCELELFRPNGHSLRAGLDDRLGQAFTLFQEEGVVYAMKYPG